MIGAYQFVAPYVKRRSLLWHYSMKYYLDDTKAQVPVPYSMTRRFFRKRTEELYKTID